MLVRSRRNAFVAGVNINATATLGDSLATPFEAKDMIHQSCSRVSTQFSSKLSSIEKPARERLWKLYSSSPKTRVDQAVLQWMNG